MDGAESPAEVDLHHVLANIYKGSDNFRPQVTIGKYRVDALTNDGTAWEVDGKEFHDAAKDAIRDEWILKHAKDFGVVVDRVIRIPASCVYYHRLAVECSVRVLVGLPAMNCIGASSSEYAQDWADIDVENGTFLDSLDTMLHCQSYLIVGDVIFIGNPVAFVSRSHTLWDYVPRHLHGRCSWLGVIELRTLTNRKSWITAPSTGMYELAWRRK